MRSIRVIFFALVTAVMTAAAGFSAAFDLDIKEGSWELAPGLRTQVFSYGGTVPGTPIIVRAGERVTIRAKNHLSEATNIHWHGLILPNDQDGPFLRIGPGETFTYGFTAREPGTYWYHPHFMPVLPQLDRGLYGAFIVLAPEDTRYSGDHTFILDDWLLDSGGRRIEELPQGMMEREGNLGTVNGKTGQAVPPLELRAGELHKLRFINASTAVFHTLKVTGHRFRVTHTDGHPLGEAYETDTITLAPSERIDAELFASGKPGGSYKISRERFEAGMTIPISYKSGSVPPVSSPFKAPPSRAFSGIADKKPDFTLEFGIAMGRGMGGMMGGMMGHGNSGRGAVAEEGMRWTINGRSFPDTLPVRIKKNEVVKMRLVNTDMSGMMGHPADHPIHIHGTYFQVLSVNNRPPAMETWKDTITVPYRGFVDIAFVMTEPGEWMLHCHIIDHEDGGMMTTVEVR